MQAPAQVPVTLLTGYLGAGKTTLLNHILTANHGKRIAVIENEFGEIGIDHDLVINADEEIFEMNNGCLCCTVRGDLIRILGNLMKRRDKFDQILVETTGLADPGPVAQTFFMDDETRDTFKLDAIVTIVDAKHVLEHVDDSDEVKEQIAFADVILLNKCDLVSLDELDHLERRIRGMNSMVRIHRTVNAQIDMDQILDQGAFDLDRALAMKPGFLEPEYPFEWAGVYTLPAGDVRLSIGDEHEHDHGHGHAHEHDHDHENHHHDHEGEAKLVILPLGAGTVEGLNVTLDAAALAFAHDNVVVHPGQAIDAYGQPIVLCGEGQCHADFSLRVTMAGAYAIFAEHHPDEFGLRLADANGKRLRATFSRAFESHEHDDEVYSVGLSFDRPFVRGKLEEWLGNLLQTQGADIYRMKGILDLAGERERYVFQGVHMLLDGKPGKPWGTDEKRGSSIVFIGKKLNRDALRAGLESCLT